MASRAFATHRLKGWGFRPVLEPGSPLHRAYTEAWADLMAQIAINPRNHL